MKAVLLDLFGPGTWGAGGNLVAWVLCGVIAGTWAWLFRRRIAAWWARVHPHAGTLAEIRDMAQAAHRISADLYRHHTGTDHPDAPCSNQEAP